MISRITNVKKTIISILTILAIYSSANLIAKASIVESGCLSGEQCVKSVVCNGT